MYTLTHHQVMPEILDFFFPFGQQIYSRDFFFSGFRFQNRLLKLDSESTLLKLGRSGREIRMCYSLKSVEKSEEDHSPWSVRQTAIYHSFDIETAVALWISVKGNDLIQDRIMCTTENFAPGMRPYGTKERAFEEALSIHLIICKWAGEEWRWYLNYLEEELHGNTRRTLSAKVVRDRRPEDKQKLEFLRTRTMSSRVANNNEKNDHQNLLRPPQASGQSRPNRTRSISRDSKAEPQGQDQFSFQDLQHVQLLEDKANEAIFVLNANIDVLRTLREHYQDLIKAEDCIKGLGANIERIVDRFDRHLATIVNDLKMQIARAGALMRMLADRKALVCTECLFYKLLVVYYL